MFRRRSDNDRWTGGYLSQTTSYDSGRSRDCGESRRGYGDHDARDADDGGHGHNSAVNRWPVYDAASGRRDYDAGDDGHGGSRRRCCTSDVDDSADHGHGDDESYAGQVGDG